MDIPSAPIVPIPHSSFQALGPTASYPPSHNGDYKLAFPESKEPLGGLTYSQYFYPTLHQDKTQHLPLLPVLDGHVGGPLNCAGCINHDDCTMFKPMTTKVKLDIGQSQGQSHVKRARPPGSMGALGQEGNRSELAGPNLKKPVDVTASSEGYRDRSRAEQRGSPAPLPQSSCNQSTQGYSDGKLSKSVKKELNKTYRGALDVGRPNDSSRTEENGGVGQRGSLASSPHSGLALHSSGSGTHTEGDGRPYQEGIGDDSPLGKERDLAVDEFLNKSPTNKRYEFNNAVATELFPLKHHLFPSKRAFQSYLTEQQKWRWDFYHAYLDVATRVNNTLYKPSSGFAQNCTRFASMPERPRGEDVRRCEATSKVLEDTASRIANYRIEVLKRKGSVIYTETGEARLQPCPSELKFLEKIFDDTDKLYQGVLTMMSNVNTTWEKLQRLFSEEQVERAERQRVLRRQRENTRKKKKRAMISLEKAAAKLLCRLAPLGSGQTEHQRDVDELNILELNMLNTRRDAELLQFLLEKQCFNGQAVQVILGKIRMLEVICGRDNVPPPPPPAPAPPADG